MLICCLWDVPSIVKSLLIQNDLDDRSFTAKPAKFAVATVVRRQNGLFFTGHGEV